MREGVRKKRRYKEEKEPRENNYTQQSERDIEIKRENYTC